jgi:hypothetical protein
MLPPVFPLADFPLAEQMGFGPGKGKLTALAIKASEIPLRHPGTVQGEADDGDHLCCGAGAWPGDGNRVA